MTSIDTSQTKLFTSRTGVPMKLLPLSPLPPPHKISPVSGRTAQLKTGKFLCTWTVLLGVTLMSVAVDTSQVLRNTQHKNIMS